MIKKIYIDLDGVLADFDKKVSEISASYPTMHKSSANFWKAISKQDHYYLYLDLMPEAKQLMDYLESLDIPLAILTGLPRQHSVPTAKEDKKAWVKHHFGDIEFNIGPYSKDKQRYSGEGYILIDDRPLNIDQWKCKGGHGILYKDLNGVKKSLQRLLKHQETV